MGLTRSISVSVNESRSAMISGQEHQVLALAPSRKDWHSVGRAHSCSLSGSGSVCGHPRSNARQSHGGARTRRAGDVGPAGLPPGTQRTAIELLNYGEEGLPEVGPRFVPDCALHGFVLERAGRVPPAQQEDRQSAPPTARRRRDAGARRGGGQGPRIRICEELVSLD